MNASIPGQRQIVFECYISGKQETFEKHETWTGVQDWLFRHVSLKTHIIGDHIHIVAHDAREYDPS